MSRRPDQAPRLASASLLGVFAHPDDESLACGALLARCAEEGAELSLLCLTRGEHGPGGAPETLGATRARELLEAARVLGVHRVVQLGHEDGMLPWLDPVRLEEDIRSVIEEVKPDVVVTFDEDGLYGHPDHIAVHERTTAAVAALGVGAPLLRYVSMPPGAMRQLTQAVASGSVASARSPAPAPAIFGNLDPDAFGAMAPPPTLVMELAAWAPRKLQALRCHRTQLEGSVLDQIDVEEAVRFLGIEHYRHAGAGAPGPAFVDHLPGTSDPTASR